MQRPQALFTSPLLPRPQHSPGLPRAQACSREQAQHLRKEHQGSVTEMSPVVAHGQEDASAKGLRGSSCPGKGAQATLATTHPPLHPPGPLDNRYSA